MWLILLFFILNTIFLVSKCFGLEVLTQTSLINMETFYLHTKKARGRVPSKFGVSQWPDNSILDPSSVSNVAITIAAPS